MSKLSLLVVIAVALYASSVVDAQWYYGSYGYGWPYYGSYAYGWPSYYGYGIYGKRQAGFGPAEAGAPLQQPVAENVNVQAGAAGLASAHPFSGAQPQPTH